MSEPLVDLTPDASYREVQTGLTVRGPQTITRGILANLACLARPAKRTVTSGLGQASGTLTTRYRRSHTSIKQAVVSWWYRKDPDPFTLTPTTITVDLTIRDEFGNSVASSAGEIPRTFRSTTSVTADRAVTFVPLDNFALGGRGYLDLDALAATLTGDDWSFELAITTSGGNARFDRFELAELPRAEVAVVSGDPYGVILGQLNVSNPVRAEGYEQLARSVEGAVLCNRTYVSLAWPEDITADIPQTTATSFAALTNFEEGSGVRQKVRVRVRPIAAAAPSGSAAGEPARSCFRFYVDGGGSASVRVHTGATGSPFVLSGLSGASWQWSDWLDTPLPTDGTAQIATLEIDAKVDSGSTLYLAHWQVDEHQT